METATSRRTCAGPGCPTRLSRHTTGDLCGACERRAREAAFEKQARQEVEAEDRRAQDQRHKDEPAASINAHQHLGPLAKGSISAHESIEWRRPDPAAGHAVMLIETCSCQSPRYELLRISGYRLIRVTTTEADHRPDVRETWPMRACHANALWERLLAGRAH
jgi:hypothetical protein